MTVAFDKRGAAGRITVNEPDLRYGLEAIEAFNIKPGKTDRVTKFEHRWEPHDRFSSIQVFRAGNDGIQMAYSCWKLCGGPTR